jgi:Arc/MetJ-type ribon-helix-helix transcriptional regulator
MMKTVEVKLPDLVYRQIDNLVKKGWFVTHEEVINQALRKFLEANRPELLQKMIEDDVRWGLDGTT